MVYYSWLNPNYNKKFVINRYCTQVRSLKPQEDIFSAFNLLSDPLNKCQQHRLHLFLLLFSHRS